MTQREVVLVEGDSDRIALETLAARLGRDLAAEGVEIISMSGVTNVRGHLRRFAPNVSVVVMCDDRESCFTVSKPTRQLPSLRSSTACLSSTRYRRPVLAITRPIGHYACR